MRRTSVARSLQRAVSGSLARCGGLAASCDPARMFVMRNLLSRQPWYVAGLAVECAGCGRCCAGPEEGHVWLTKDQTSEIAQYLNISEDQMLSQYVRKIGRRFSLVERQDNKDCIFLTIGTNGRKQCRIYPVRPIQCRTWPFWPNNLRSSEAWALAGLRCDGINRGRLYSYDEIEAKRKATGS